MAIVESIIKERSTSADTSQFILPGFENAENEIYQKRREALLNHYFTNVSETLDSPGEPRVLAIKNMPSVVSAALVARFSRAEQTDITDLFWDEFIDNPTLGVALVSEQLAMGGIEEALAQQEARALIRRIIDRFGDDSVREDASGVLVAEGFSVLTAMETFTHPLIIGIEASTRFIEWGKEDKNGRFRYGVPQNIANSEYANLFMQSMDQLFETYQVLWQPVWDYVVLKNPKPDDVSDAAYTTAVRGRVCDNLRRLLPLGIKTNFGIHATYRTLTEAVLNLRAADLGETVEFANQLATELNKINPEFVAVVFDSKGDRWTQHQLDTKRILRDFVSDVVHIDLEDMAPILELEVKNEDYLLEIVMAVMSQERPQLSIYELEEIAKEKISKGEIKQLFEDLGNARTNRRHKVLAALETVGLRVIFRGASFATFKDLNRHRKIDFKTSVDYSGEEGFYIPEDIKEMRGVPLELYLYAQNKALAAKRQIEQVFPEESSRLLTHGMKTTFHIHLGLAEAFWIAELRTMASGDPEYRWFAQQLWHQMTKLMPELEWFGSFVDEEDYPLNRIKEAIAADNRGRTKNT